MGPFLACLAANAADASNASQRSWYPKREVLVPVWSSACLSELPWQPVVNGLRVHHCICHQVCQTHCATYCYHHLLVVPARQDTELPQQKVPSCRATVIIAASGLPVQQLSSLHCGKAPSKCCRTQRRSSRLISINISKKASCLHCTLHSYKDNPTPLATVKD